MAIQQYLSDASDMHGVDTPGTFIKAYRTHISWAGLVLFCLITPLILAVEGSLIYLLVSSLSDSTLSFSLPEELLLVFIALVVPLIVYFALWDHDTVVTPIHRKILVSLYSEGFIYSVGRRRQVITWENIRVIQRLVSKQAKKKHYEFKLKLFNGTDITLKGIINDIQELGTAIEHAMLQRLLPQVRADYEANKSIVFPGLCFNQCVVCKSNEQLPWQAIETFIFGPEKLVIKVQSEKKDWLSAPIPQFLNACVLEALLRQVCEEKHVQFIT